MKPKILILICFCCSILCLNSQTRSELSDKLIQDLVSNDKVVGVTAGFMVVDDTIWTGAEGYADRNSKTPFNVDTEVRIASIAKPMTAIAIMQLVEQGKVDLDKPIDDYIPEFVQKGTTKITTRHLLSHTSGMDAYKNRKEFENTTNYKSLLDAYNVFKDRKLKFEPGTKYAYTTYGYVVLGMLIEKVSGQSYEAYMQEHIWDKASMTQTGINVFGEVNSKTSALYHKDKKGKLVDAEENDLSNRIPGGGFYSTVEDILKFGTALLNNTLVKAETLKLMTEHHSLEKVKNSYGFGFYLYGQAPDVGSVIGHSGAQTGASAQFFVIPKWKTVIVALSNTSGAGREVSGLAGQLIQISQKKE